MAFTLATLNLIANGSRPITTSASGSTRSRLYYYITNDAHSVVVDTGYFNAAVAMLSVGDIIIAAVDIDGTVQPRVYAVTANDGTAVTVAV